jgi:hypothetical protein
MWLDGESVMTVDGGGKKVAYVLSEHKLGAAAVVFPGLPHRIDRQDEKMIGLGTQCRGRRDGPYVHIL